MFKILLLFVSFLKFKVRLATKIIKGWDIANLLKKTTCLKYPSKKSAYVKLLIFNAPPMTFSPDISTLKKSAKKNVVFWGRRTSDQKIRNTS